jgi:branched-chain amino acid transport system substrate-binding protein
METRRTRWWGIASAAALVLAACGGDNSSSSSGAGATTAAGGATTTAAQNTTAAPAGSAASTTASAASSTASSAAASGKSVKLGALTSLTGNFAPWGVQVRDGMKLAVDEINAAGGANGRKLELTVSDDQSKPDVATTEIQRLIEGGAVAIGGTISSDVGLATARLAEQQTTPLFLVKAGSEKILTQNSRYTFRTCLPAAPMVAGPIAQYVKSKGITKVGAIVADYAWGQAIRAALENELGGLGGVQLQVEVAPVPEKDFTTYLRSLQQFGPELLVATGHPPGSGAITVQSKDLGLDVPVTGAYSVWEAVMSGAADAAVGRYADFDCADYSSPGYQALAKKYLAASDNKFMDDDAVAGYGIVKMVAQAVGAVGDDPKAIAAYLHGQTFDLPGYSFKMGWTAWGELATAQPVFTIAGAGPAPAGVNEAGAWYPEKLLLPDPLPPYSP